MDIIVTDEFRHWYEMVIDEQAARDVYREVVAGVPRRTRMIETIAKEAP